MLEFALIAALMGRRARRFFMGAEIPELEKLLVVTACGGNTGWHYRIYRAKLDASRLSNYSAAADFHTRKTLFTDDEGVYLACADRASGPRSGK